MSLNCCSRRPNVLLATLRRRHHGFFGSIFGLVRGTGLDRVSSQLFFFDALRLSRLCVAHRR